MNKIGLVLPNSISPKQIKRALNHGKRRGVLRKDVAKALGMTPSNLLYLTTGQINTVSLDTILTIQEMTGFDLLGEDFFQKWHEQKAA